MDLNDIPFQAQGVNALGAMLSAAQINSTRAQTNFENTQNAVAQNQLQQILGMQNYFKQLQAGNDPNEATTPQAGAGAVAAAANGAPPVASSPATGPMATGGGMPDMNAMMAAAPSLAPGVMQGYLARQKANMDYIKEQGAMIAPSMSMIVKDPSDEGVRAALETPALKGLPFAKQTENLLMMMPPSKRVQMAMGMTMQTPESQQAFDKLFGYEYENTGNQIVGAPKTQAGQILDAAHAASGQPGTVTAQNNLPISVSPNTAYEVNMANNPQVQGAKAAAVEGSTAAAKSADEAVQGMLPAQNFMQTYGKLEKLLTGQLRDDNGNPVPVPIIGRGANTISQKAEYIFGGKALSPLQLFKSYRDEMVIQAKSLPGQQLTGPLTEMRQQLEESRIGTEDYSPSTVLQVIKPLGQQAANLYMRGYQTQKQRQQTGAVDATAGAYQPPYAVIPRSLVNGALGSGNSFTAPSGAVITQIGG